MAKIRDDLVGVVYVGTHVLKAGDEVPRGITLGGHLVETVKKSPIPRKSKEATYGASSDTE